MTNISPTMEGFLRGLGMAFIFALLTFIGNEANLAFLNPGTAAIVASLALWLEGALKNSTGGALFGAVKS